MTTGLRVWKVHLDRSADSRWWRMLSATERDRGLRLASPLEQRRFMVAHAALRAILGRLCGVRATQLMFLAGVAGRPYLALPNRRRPLDFNLSRSGEWAMVAVTSPVWRVGVDVERVRRDLDCLEMARSMYQPAEVDRLCRAADPVARRTEYFRLWSAKEAYVKAVGVGLAGFRDVLVRRDDNATRGTVRSGSLAGAGWPVRWLDVAPGYAAAVVRTAATDGR